MGSLPTLDDRPHPDLLSYAFRASRLPCLLVGVGRLASVVMNGFGTTSSSTAPQALSQNQSISELRYCAPSYDVLLVVLLSVLRPWPSPLVLLCSYKVLRGQVVLRRLASK